MSRTTSLAARQALYKQETGDDFIVLLRLSHTDMAEDILVNNSGEDIVSDGDTFVAYPFDIILPEDDAGRPGVATVLIDNTDRIIYASLSQLQGPVTVDITVVRNADPDTVEMYLPDFELRVVPFDVAFISGRLSIEDIASEPYPGGTFGPALFPSLF